MVYSCKGMAHVRQKWGTYDLVAPFFAHSTRLHAENVARKGETILLEILAGG